MHTLQMGPSPTTPVDELAWVFDGVQVTLGKRNLYVCGRTHALRPDHLSWRQRSDAAFRDRLMIPAPHHRAALAYLVRAGSKGVLCDDRVRDFVRWLASDSGTGDGGWCLRLFVRLEWDVYDDDEDKCELPLVGEATVRIHDESLRDLRSVLMHWASNTPEVHVIPPRTVVLARQWLQQEGKVPKTGIAAIANTSPLLYELLMTDTRSTDPLAGHFWQLSPQLQDLLTRMVLIVERSVTCSTEHVAGRGDDTEDGGVQQHSEYALPAGVDRTVPTALERMLWHAEHWPGFPVVCRVQRYAFDEDRQGQVKARTHTRRVQETHGCSKYPTRPAERNRGHGLLTAACARCCRITGFSILPAAESPKSVFDVIVTRLAPQGPDDEREEPEDEDGGGCSAKDTHRERERGREREAQKDCGRVLQEPCCVTGVRVL